MRHAFIVLGFFIAFLIMLFVIDSYTVDSCLDSGGSWDYEEFSCKK